MSGSITRRGVLTGAAALAGMTALPPLLKRHAVIGHVVVDERLPHSLQFAASFKGANAHRISALDDLCNRWYTQLRDAVLADRGHIAGLTTWMDYVVMRSCATEIGYRRAFHAEHQPLTDAAVSHAVSTQPDLLDSLTMLANPQNWARALGTALAAGAHVGSRIVSGRTFTATAAAAAGHVRMVSWVFSPRV